MARTSELKEPRNRNLVIRVSDTEYNEIKEIAEKLDMPPTAFARNLMLVGFDDAKLFNAVGILKGIKKAIEFKEKFKEARSKRLCATN